jgi:hypothetical protein
VADDVTDPNAPVPDAPDDAAAHDGADRSVHIPPWLAAALVVVLGLAIGAAGFAIGRATADDNGHFTPVVNQLPGGQPGPGGGRGLPGLRIPLGPGFPGGDREPGDRYGHDRGPGNRGPERSTTTSTEPKS